MKKIQIATMFLLTAMAMATSANAQSAYEKGMKSALEELFPAEGNKENWQNAANRFERIANVEKDKWQPIYYAALSYAWMATREETLNLQDEKMDKARQFIEAGLVLSAGNVELLTLQGYADMLSIAFDPSSRGQLLSTRVFQTFGKAIQMDPKNPRARLFMAQMQDGTERFFAQGNQASCETLRVAVQNYEQQKEKDDFSPMWGRGMAEQMAANCGK